MKVKVKNAKVLPHHKHDLTHDVSTTYDWGHMQPLMCRELPAGSKSTLRVGQIVRLMSMVLPTFGRLSLNTYNVFVPMESIFHPYASLRAGQTYMGANRTYIPQQVLTITPWFLNCICKSMSTISIFNGQPVFNGIRGFYVDKSQVQPEVITEELYNAYLEQTLSSQLIQTELFSDISYLRKFVKFDNHQHFYNFDGYDWIDTFRTSDSYYIVCGKYHESARNFRKVLYGLGYKLIDNFEPVSALPLFAYYKAWFDLFAPQRDITWKDTACAGIQEYCEQNGIFNLYYDDFLAEKTDILYQFILDLCSTYYTQSPDFVSAHITGQRISTVANDLFATMDSRNEVLNSIGTNNTVINGGVSFTNSNVAPVGRLLNQSNLDLLERLTHRINAKTVIGGKIREFLKTQLGADYLDEDETYWIGSQKLDINISPVFSNAQTEQGYLGEFAGQGAGGTQGETFTYENKVDGFWICMSAIVPDSRFAQGMDMNLKHVRKNDFYDPMFDSITLLPTSKKYIFAEANFSNRVVTPSDDYQMQTSDAFEASFGNIPNMIEYCIAQNIQNGDMSLRSKRSSYLPFTLDKLLPYTEEYDGDLTVSLFNTPLDIVVNSTIWQYIGLYKWIGNYNRIFQNSGTVYPSMIQDIRDGKNGIFYNQGYDDNFIGHNVLDFKVWNTKLPIRNSFQTGAFDEGAISLEKA